MAKIEWIVGLVFVGTVVALASFGDHVPQSLGKGANDRLYFSVDDATRGSELWTSDGTPLGTNLVRDINPGQDGSSPQHFATLGASTVFLAARDGTWSTPSSDLGAERSPLRRRMIDILDAEERADISWPTLACSEPYALGRDGRVSQVTRLGTLPTSAHESNLAAVTRARDIALEGG